MLAAQAGVSLETAILYGGHPQDVRGVREGERRGDRVARSDDERPLAARRGAHRDAGEGGRRARRAARTPAPRSSREDLRELEYASLLHDFGKIGVREKVLVKAKKLYDERLELVRARFDYVARSIEADVLARKVRLLETGGPRDGIEALDRELAQRRADLDGAWEAICTRQRADRPVERRLRSGSRRSRKETFVDLRGEVRPLLDDEETTCLRVNRGSLTPPGVRRDPVARLAHLPVPVADPVGQGAQPGAHHRGRAPREAERHRIPEPPSRRGDPRAIEDDEPSPTSTTR